MSIDYVKAKEIAEDILKTTNQDFWTDELTPLALAFLKMEKEYEILKDEYENSIMLGTLILKRLKELRS